MLQYLIILLDNTSTSFCHYAVTNKEPKLIALNTLKDAVVFAMKANLSVQFVYPSYKLPEEYTRLINTIDHCNIKPLSFAEDDTDVIVIEEWSNIEKETFAVPIIIRTDKKKFFQQYVTLKKVMKHTARTNVVITDIDKFKNEDFEQYNKALSDLSSSIEQLYIEGRFPQLNILTDRMTLHDMNNCGAGYSSITLAPNGKFYVCPAFYYDDEADYIGDLACGLDIKNKQLYNINYAPICRQCDAWQCKRCIWMNRKTTLEVNTPSHEQCVVAHVERNISRMLLTNIRRHGSFLPEFDEIKEIDYLDPFDKRKEW